MALEVSNSDPASERFNAALASLLLGIVGMAFGFVAAGLISSWSSPLGWLIIAVATLAGLTPLARWAHSTGRTNRITLWDLEPRWKRQLIAAAASVDRIEQARRILDDGPVTDHLDETHSTALGYLKAIEAAARQSGDAAFFAEVSAIGADLSDLADASEDLVRAALPHGPARLRELTERTKALSEALADHSLVDGSLIDDSPTLGPGSTSGH